MDKLRKENESFWWITQFLLNLIHVNPCLKRRRYIYKHPFQLRYLEVLGSIFTCTIMFRYTWRIPFPANTPKWSFSVTAEWTGGVTVVFSCLTLVYVWKLRINVKLSNCRLVKHHNMPYTFLFWRCFYHFNLIYPLLNSTKEEDISKVSILIRISWSARWYIYLYIYIHVHFWKNHSCKHTCKIL